MSDKRIGRGTQLIGAYRVVPTRLWDSLHGLRPHDRLVMLALKTGSTSSFAGIGFVYVEALARETGLTASEVEAALANLEKRPSPSTSWIVRDGPVIWVRAQLKTDPVVQKSGGKPNPDQQKGISRHVGALPQDNVAVLRFLRHYKGMLNNTVEDTKGKTEGGTVGGTVGGSPASAATPASTTTPAAARETRTLAHAIGSDNGQATTPVRRDDAPAEWFNDCAEGQVRRACVKTEYLARVDLGTQCFVHERMRRELEAKG